jgi:hypothetical protein
MKYSANGGRFFGRFKSKDRRDSCAAALANFGIVVETYEAEIADPPAPVVLPPADDTVPPMADPAVVVPPPGTVFVDGAES